MDVIPEPVWQYGSTVVTLVCVIAAGLKWGLPALIAQIEREREVANERFAEQREHYESQADSQRQHHEVQMDKLVTEFGATREMLEKRADSWKQALDKLDESVQSQTTVMQSEMVKSREEYARAIRVRDRHEVQP